MMMDDFSYTSSDSKVAQDPENVIEETEDGEKSSTEELNPSEWPSLENVVIQKNPKRVLQEAGLYSPGSGEICTKELKISSSSIVHPYSKYPAVVDPGIKAALLHPYQPPTFSDDGRDLYKSICEETNVCQVGLFYRNLLNEEINLSYYGVSYPGVRAMAIALRHNHHVKRFNLTDNFLDNDACYHLGEMLKTNRTLEELNLSGCRIGSAGLLRIIKHVGHNRHLKSLVIPRNNLCEDGGLILANLMFEGNHIERLNVSFNKLGAKTANELAENLEFSNILTHLDLSWNNFVHIPSIVSLLQQLSCSEVLEELNVSWNSLEGLRVATEIKNITLIPTLRVLNLSNNRFNDADVEIMVEFITKARRLNTLNLSYNPLSPAGALCVLQKMLRPRIRIEKLLMEKICVNREFIQCLDRLKRRKALSKLVVEHGELVRDWVIKGSDPRDLILRRAEYLGHLKKTVNDVPLYLIHLSTQYNSPVEAKDLYKRIADDNVPLDEDLVSELSNVFPGSKLKNSTTVDLKAVRDYIRRLWPEKWLLTVDSDVHLKKKKRYGRRKK